MLHTRICKQCEKEYNNIKSNGKHLFINQFIKTKFCSRVCARLYKKSHPITVGVNNFNWKGDKVSYRGLHKWIGKKLGKPLFCSYCGFVDKNKRKFHWSNISGQYKRDFSDWQRLCAKCHRAYDIMMKESKRTK